MVNNNFALFVLLYIVDFATNLYLRHFLPLSYF
jgi:hypothetical protein